MKRRELEKVIEKYVQHIARHCKKIPGSFDTEDIHELRVEYKKLRAFVRLLQPDKDAGNDLAIPQRLKSVYQAAGAVRDLQLFLHRSAEELADEQSQAPTFARQLRRQLFEAKEALVKEIEKADFDKITETITGEVPPQLQEDTIRKFVHLKVATVRLVLLALEKEKELHTIRKQLKDILYNIKTFQNEWGIPFPVVAWKSEKLLNDMATKLGDFNDLCLTVSFLKTTPENLPAAELIVVENMRNHYLQQQSAQKQLLIQQVHQLNLMADF